MEDVTPRCRGLLLRSAVCVLAALSSALSQGADFAGPTVAASRGVAGKPITTADGAVGELLRKWWAEGTAAGNVGDRYDNRDRGHSQLDITPYPQLSKVQYGDEDRKKNRDWAVQMTVLPPIVFGNSSTSAPILQGGSNIRQYYTHPQGLPFLFTQYSRCNIYAYPEHQDHDPGHNGVGGGYGDVYPTNTPYLIASQGSSGSDQPFLKAMPFALAAFRPEVKQTLVQTGLLMPTMQMILRTTGRQLVGSAVTPFKDIVKSQYLTGKAHPTVFEGSWVDELKMVQMAHDIQLDNIPPLAVLKVLDESQARQGEDFFDGATSEKLADTLCVIARFLRGSGYSRRMVVSAEQSFDANKLPLTFHWVVLRGDADRIKITPHNKQGSVAEIVVPYHDRAPVFPGSPLESNRVDIGVFVHNGTHFSAPSFITFYSFDWEGRTYDASGRLLDIGYSMGTSEVNVSNWMKLLDTFQNGTPAGQLLKQGMKNEEIVAVLQAMDEYKTAWQSVEVAQKALEKRGTAENATASTAARKALDDANGAAAGVLGKIRPPLKASVQARLEGRLDEMMRDGGFLLGNEKTLLGISEKDLDKKFALRSVRKELVGFGMSPRKQGERFFEITPLRPGSAPLNQRLTKYERATMERLNARILSSVLYDGAVTSVYHVNYVDPRLSSPKLWRDVYHYDAKGYNTGWTRYDGEVGSEYNHAGQRVLQTDAKGRCIRARVVKYEPVPQPQVPAGWDVGSPYRPIKAKDTRQIVLYEYSGDDDFVGKVKSNARMGAPEKGSERYSRPK